MQEGVVEEGREQRASKEAERARARESLLVVESRAGEELTPLQLNTVL